MERIAAIISAVLLQMGVALAAEPVDSVRIEMPWHHSADRVTATGYVGTISGSDLKYPAADLRNMLAGQFVGLEINEVSGALTSLSAANLCTYNMFNGSNVSATSRAATDAILCLVDDIPVPFSQLLLDPSQIESVSFLNSICDKIKFGPLASNGIISIKTRRGGFSTPLKVVVDFESGVGLIDRTGEWVDGVDYARLNNAARMAAGYTPLYDDTAMAGFAARNPLDKAYPNVDFRQFMIRDTKPLSRFGFNASGGSRGIAYSIGLSGVHEGGYLIGGSDHDFNKINFNSNVSARIGRYMKVSVGVIGSVAILRTPDIAYNAYRLIPAVAYPLILGTNNGYLEDFSNNTLIYGVSKLYDTNYYAALQTGRFYNTRSNTGTINAAFDVDLGWLVKGLKSRTCAYMGVNDMIKVGKANDYIAYYMTTGDPDLGELSAKHQGAKVSGKSKSTQSLWQQFSVYETLSWDMARENHKAATSLTYYISDTRSGQDSFYERQQDLIASASYSYGGRYAIEASAAYSGSSAFMPGQRYCLFPSVGASWVISNEDFLKGSSSVDLLKLRAQVGVTGAAGNVYAQTRNLWDSRYSYSSGITFGPATNGRWFGTQTRSSSYTTMTRIANPDLGWEKVTQAEVGVDARLFGGLDVMAQYFVFARNGIITETTGGVSSVYGIDGTSVYENYNGMRYSGIEAAVSYSGRSGDFSYRVGANAATCSGVFTRYANDLYLYDWQRHTGSDPDAIRGYVCTGKFESMEQLAVSPRLDSGAQVGDLMYEDLNGDGTIDSNDIKVIGTASPRLRYAVSLNLKWKNLDFTLVGTGRAFCSVALTNEYYWNGWGDGNYSAFVRDNVGKDYPSLSYVKNTNNFVTSDFWLRDGGYFKIQNVELGWTPAFRFIGRMGLDGVRLYVRGANLLTVSKVDDLDPESLSAGVSTAPLYRTFTGGIKFNF